MRGHPSILEQMGEILDEGVVRGWRTPESLNEVLGSIVADEAAELFRETFECSIHGAVLQLLRQVLGSLSKINFSVST